MAKRVTFEDDKNIRLEGEIVKASANALNNDVNCEHLIEHALSCTLERIDKHGLYVDGLRFGTIHKLFNMEHLRFH